MTSVRDFCVRFALLLVKVVLVEGPVQARAAAAARAVCAVPATPGTEEAGVLDGCYDRGAETGAACLEDAGVAHEVRKGKV